MLDLIFDNIDVILDIGAEILGIGAAAFLVYKVTETITEKNIPALFMRALKNTKSQLYKKALRNAVQGAIKTKGDNEISIEVLESTCPDLKGKTIQIKSSRGVDSSIKVGKKMSFIIEEC